MNWSTNPLSTVHPAVARRFKQEFCNIQRLFFWYVKTGSSRAPIAFCEAPKIALAAVVWVAMVWFFRVLGAVQFK